MPDSQKDVLADFYAIVADFYDRIMTHYGKKKIKGRENVRSRVIGASSPHWLTLFFSRNSVLLSFADRAPVRVSRQVF